MERLINNINFNQDRLIFLYGINSTDRFITKDYRDVNIYEALHELLLEKGFECILFYSHTGRVFFLDENSKEYCRVQSEKLRTNSDSSESNQPIRFSGPLGTVRTQDFDVKKPAHEEHSQRPNENRRATIGDSYALELIDWVMRATEQKSAVVICQAETSLTYFDLRGAQADRMGEWLRLPPIRNRNKCILIFDSDDLVKNVMDNPNFIPIPAFQDRAINKSKQKNQKTFLKIPSPSVEEVKRMLQMARINTRKPLFWDQFERISNLISNDEESLQHWLMILHHEANQIDINALTPYLSSARNSSNFPTWQEELNSLVGLENVKSEIKQLENLMKDRVNRQKKGLIKPGSSPRYLHLLFKGNPGTGKTTVARLIGDMYRDLGLLKKGHVIEVEPADLVEDHVGGSNKRARERIEEAINGVLFIDEAYQLSENQFGQEVIGVLLKAMEDDRHRLAVVMAGYTNEMQELFKLNTGLRRRIPEENEIEFPDYNPDELLMIFQRFLEAEGLQTSPEFTQTLHKIIVQMYNDRDINKFENAGKMKTLADAIVMLHANRKIEENLPDDTPIIIDDLPETARQYLTPTAPDINTVMAELNNMIGLHPIKQTVINLVADLETQPWREALGQPVEQKSINMVFSGNPGTGKTTVAKLMGKILKSVGILRTDNVEEVRASDLIAGYVGQTAEKTEEAFKKALDGVLFIDEAYELTPKHDHDTYRSEAIGVLMAFIDRYPNRLAIISAGYPIQMNEFITSNPGLLRRFSRFEFPDYSDEELLEILQLKVSAKIIELPASTAQRALAYFKQERERAKRNGEPFINAGLVDALLRIMITNQNNRFREIRDPEILRSFIPDDIPGAPIIHQKPADQSVLPAYKHYDLVSRLPAAKTTKLDDAMNACCLIEVTQGEEQGTGTGFIVSEDGYMITAYHVINGAETIQARLNGQKIFYPAEVVGVDEQWDITVLRLPDGQAYPYISLAPEGFAVEVMQEVCVLGFPLGVDYGDEITATKGPISSLRYEDTTLQLDVSMTHGSSGGPVLDQENGYVLGIVQGGAEDVRSRFNFATRTQIIYQRFGTSPVR